MYLTEIERRHSCYVEWIHLLYIGDFSASFFIDVKGDQCVLKKKTTLFHGLSVFVSFAKI